MDIDLTPLPASKHAEGSTKGKISAKKNSYGRQLARVHAPQYHETLCSRLYPGKQASSPTYLPVVAALDTFLGFSSAQKARTILRSDGGFGSDTNVNTALQDNWQVVTKSSGGRRPGALVRQVTDDAWLELRPNDRWVAPVTAPVALVRPVQWLAVRWRTQRGELKQAVVVCSVPDWSPAEVIAHYDAQVPAKRKSKPTRAGCNWDSGAKRSWPRRRRWCC